MGEQHPIPQQISSYQFRLVGDMTLKQFFQVGAGALIAIILYSSNLPGYVKWPLILISFLFGVALAFFPLEDRPLSKWLVLFAKSIYSPTLYVWMNNYQKPQYFQEEALVQDTAVYTPPAPPVAEETPAELEQTEQQFLEKVDTFSDSAVPTQLPDVTPQEAPLTIDAITPAVPAAVSSVATAITEEEKKEPIQVPTQAPVAVEKSDKTAEFDTQTQQEITDVGTDINPMVGQKLENVASAQFSNEASPPIPPTRPNIIVGQVMDNNGKIVENAILEVKDEEGISRRALRTNKLGHFISVTPLMDGKYDIITEKDGLSFDPISINANGEIIPPIAIRAKQIANA